MATLRYRRDRKRWEVDYRRGRGRRFKKLFLCKRIAAEFRRKMEELIERENAGLATIEPVTFSEFCRIFLANHFAEKSEKYQRTAAYQIHRQFVPCFGNTAMTEVTLEHIVDWKGRREGQNVAPKTIREDLALLQLIFKAAIKNRYALTNPVEDIEWPKATPRKRRSAVADAMLMKDVRNLPTFERGLVLLLRNTGLRLGELFRLRPEDIDYGNRLIAVRSELGATTKNYEARQTILTPTAAAILMQLCQHGGLWPMKQRTFEARFYEQKKRQQLTWDLHSLRHSFITTLRNANIPERVVAHYVGHAQRSQTDRYTAFLPEFIDASVCAADFGQEFVGGPADVVSIWSPPKTPSPQTLVNPRQNDHHSVPGAGLEPARAD